MRIALCEDEQEALERLRGHVNDYCAKEGITVEVDCFFSGGAGLRRRWSAVSSE